MDAVSLALAKNYTNEKLNSFPSNAPTKTVTFDGGIYSVGNDVVNGQVSDVVIKGLTATNILRNGDFATGDTSDWSKYPTGATLSYENGGGKILLLPDASHSSLQIRQTGHTFFAHKYYCATKIYSNKSNLIDVGMSTGDTIPSSGSDNMTSLGRCTENTWVRLSAVVDGVDGATEFKIGKRNAVNYGYAENDYIIVDNVLLIDLTTTFGASNEPTVEQCDKMFANYFDGTKSTNSVRIRSVNEDETKESIAYVNLPQGEELRSLPNGVKDEVNATDGTKTQRVKEYALQASDIVNYNTTETFDRIEINKPNDFIGYGNTSYWNAFVLDGFTTVNEGNFFEMNNYEISSRFGTTKFYAKLPKGKYADIASARTALAGTALIYQLATPIVTQLPAQPPLQVYENGTVYVEPIGDASESTLPSVEMTIPTGTSNKFGVASHNYDGAAADWTLTNSESKCFMLAVSNAGGAANIIAPNRPGTMYAISNASGYAITIKKSGGTGVVVTNAKTVLVIHNGTDYTALTAEL